MIIFNWLGVSAALEVFLSVEVSKVAVLSATTSSMGSDYMLMKMACWNPTTSSQDPVITFSRGFLTYKWLTIVDRGFINKPCFDFVLASLSTTTDKNLWHVAKLLLLLMKPIRSNDNGHLAEHTQ